MTPGMDNSMGFGGMGMPMMGNMMGNIGGMPMMGGMSNMYGGGMMAGACTRPLFNST